MMIFTAKRFVAVAFLFSFSAISLHSAEPASSTNAVPKQARGTLLKKYDKNGDGKIDEEELEAFKKSLAEKTALAKAGSAAKFDLNKDGKLDPTERAAMEDYARKAALFKRYDKNGDGKLDESERATFMKENATPPLPGK